MSWEPVTSPTTTTATRENNILGVPVGLQCSEVAGYQIFFRSSFTRNISDVNKTTNYKQTTNYTTRAL